MNTLPSPSTASPVSTASPTAKARWSGACPGVASASSGPKRVTVGEHDIDLAARGGDRDAGMPFAHRAQRLDMIDVVVGGGDATQAASVLQLGVEGVEMLGQLRPRIDQPGRIASDDPGVGSAQAQRPGIGRADADDVGPGGDQALRNRAVGPARSRA